MDIMEAVRNRRSIRAFLPKPVPKVVIEKILDAARWAPSWGNTQPWEFLVVGGETLKRIGKEFSRRVAEHVKDNPDIPMPPIPQEWPEPYRSRYMAVGKGLFDTLGVARDDKATRAAHYQRMYSFFEAPAVIYVLTGETLGQYALFDCGSVTQTICLLAGAEGLGTCIMAAAVRHPDVIRAHVSVPPGKKFVIGIATGYPDPDSPYNKYRSSRVPLGEMVSWEDV
ncbi:MAG: nitroreductase [Thermodesulfobacteriota bacterium]